MQREKLTLDGEVPGGISLSLPHFPWYHIFTTLPTRCPKCLAVPDSSSVGLASPFQQLLAPPKRLHPAKDRPQGVSRRVKDAQGLS